MTSTRPRRPDRIVVDRSAFYAVSDRDNRAATHASELMARLVSERKQLVTTNFILAELHALLLTRGNRQLALAVLQGSRHSPTRTIERVTELDEDRAWAIIEQYDDKEFSLVDAVSFAVMERLGIIVAFALDRHYAQLGWTVISDL